MSELKGIAKKKICDFKLLLNYFTIYVLHFNIDIIYFFRNSLF